MRSVIFTLVFISTSGIAFATTTKVRIAVLDNLKYEKLATERYVSDYFDGLDAFANYAKTTEGVEVERKHFYFDKRPLAILEEVEKVQAWKPDAIIGPRFSDLFLLLKDKFPETLVLSPLATATAVYEMPQNFYSIAPPNAWYAIGMMNFVKKNFAERRIKPVIETDCKYCSDWNEQFLRVAAKDSAFSGKIKDTALFLSTDVEKIDLSPLLEKSSPDDLFLIPNRSYTSGTLMGRISNHFKSDNLVFIGADGWGDWTAGYTGKYKSQNTYKGYYLTPFCLDKIAERNPPFQGSFKSVKGADPTASISLISFETGKAIVASWKRGSKKLETRKRILNGFKILTTADKNYFRPKAFAVYEVGQQGEVPSQFVNAQN